MNLETCDASLEEAKARSYYKHIRSGEITMEDLPNDIVGQAVWNKMIADSAVAPVNIATIELEEEVKVKASNPPEAFSRIKARSDYVGGFQPVLAKDLGLTPANLLTVSTKLEKGEDLKWYTEGLYLSPADMAGLGNLCGGASMGCIKGCLMASGQADFSGKIGSNMAHMIDQAVAVERKYLEDEQSVHDVPATRFNDVIETRLRRTLLFQRNRHDFMSLLQDALVLLRKRANKKQFSPCFRPNCVSDFPWESTNLCKNNPDLQIYDYTKIPGRMFRFLQSKVAVQYSMEGAQFPPPWQQGVWPANYYLTFSMSEVNFAYALIFSRMGGTVTIPFKIKATKDGVRKQSVKYALPKTFIGQPVFNADDSDCRFLDNTLGPVETGEFGPYICGLKVKGRSQKRTVSENDFFLATENFPEVWTTEHNKAFCTELLTLNVSRVRSDRHYDKGTSLWLPTPDAFARYVPELADTYKRIYEA